MEVRMDWNKLLNDERNPPAKEPIPPNPNENLFIRNPFQRDYDRIAFSSPFRRLQDKTQVFPLSKNDYIRTRLTHSHEVACIGRTLGELIGNFVIVEKKTALPERSAHDFANVVAAACLCHDIGNPPFGHKGEVAIQTWFTKNVKGEARKRKRSVAGAFDLESSQLKDFELFEGNAQGFRVLVQLYHGTGLGLTNATLGTFMKYPCGAAGRNRSHGVVNKKHGFFQDNAQKFREVAKKCGLIRFPEQDDAWCRHPLAFLVEAADDICYNIIDLEDGYRSNFVTLETANELLNDILIKAGRAINKIRESRRPLNTSTSSNSETPNTPTSSNSEIPNTPTSSSGILNTPTSGTRRSAITSDKKRPYEGDVMIDNLRGRAISQLVELAVEEFKDKYTAIMEGKHFTSLLSYEILGNLQDFLREYVYSHSDVVKIEATGFHILDELLSIFYSAIYYDHTAPKTESDAYYNTILALLPPQFRKNPAKQALSMEDEQNETNEEREKRKRQTAQEATYQALLMTTDYVSGMTDSYALHLYQQLAGIALP